MARKTIEEQLKALEEKEQILKARKQQLIAKSKEQERKARIHRLIEIGGAVESVLGRAIEKDCQGTAGRFFARKILCP